MKMLVAVRGRFGTVESSRVRFTVMTVYEVCECVFVYGVIYKQYDEVCVCGCVFAPCPPATRRWSRGHPPLQLVSSGPACVCVCVYSHVSVFVVCVHTCVCVCVTFTTYRCTSALLSEHIKTSDPAPLEVIVPSRDTPNAIHIWPFAVITKSAFWPSTCVGMARVT